MPELRSVTATRDVTPLREGGSLPGLVEADDDGAGVNVGLDFLPGSLPYTPAAGLQPAPEAAAQIVWLDALVTNVDRTPRNPNLLVWHGRLWLIDHGAALYFHHRDWNPEADVARAFPAIADHVLLPLASSIVEADSLVAERLSAAALRDAVSLVPAEWADPEAYVDDLTRRLAAPRGFAAEAERARLGLQRGAAA
jgi:hypothetical protein